MTTDNNIAMLCYSVKIKDYIRITRKSIKLIAYDGSELVIPSSCMIMSDLRYDNAYWIAAWVLDKNSELFQYSDKRKGWYDPRKRTVRPYIEIEYHEPEHIEPIADNSIDELRRIDR